MWVKGLILAWLKVQDPFSDKHLVFQTDTIKKDHVWQNFRRKLFWLSDKINLYDRILSP